jgi:hypothetical protein
MAPITAERRRELLEMTALGRCIIASDPVVFANAHHDIKGRFALADEVSEGGLSVSHVKLIGRFNASARKGWSSEDKKKLHETIHAAIANIPEKAVQLADQAIDKITVRLSGASASMSPRAGWNNGVSELKVYLHTVREDDQRRAQQKEAGPVMAKIISSTVGNYATGVFTHELGHAIDGVPKRSTSTKHPFSDDYDWKEAWQEEILGKRLTEYAATSQSEGFAEMCRLVYDGGVPMNEIEDAMPKCFAFFKTNGLLKEVS